eukprot:jgi/Mesvir1/16380/Mv18124-RA.1
MARSRGRVASGLPLIWALACVVALCIPFATLVYYGFFSQPHDPAAKGSPSLHASGRIASKPKSTPVWHEDFLQSPETESTNAHSGSSYADWGAFDFDDSSGKGSTKDAGDKEAVGNTDTGLFPAEHVPDTATDASGGHDGVSVQAPERGFPQEIFSLPSDKIAGFFEEARVMMEQAHPPDVRLPPIQLHAPSEGQSSAIQPVPEPQSAPGMLTEPLTSFLLSSQPVNQEINHQVPQGDAGAAGVDAHHVVPAVSAPAVASVSIQPVATGIQSAVMRLARPLGLASARAVPILAVRRPKRMSRTRRFRDVNTMPGLMDPNRTPVKPSLHGARCRRKGFLPTPRVTLAVLRPLSQKATVDALAVAARRITLDRAEVLMLVDGAESAPTPAHLRMASWKAALPSDIHFPIFCNRRLVTADAWNRLVHLARSELVVLLRGQDVPLLAANPRAWMAKVGDMFRADPKLALLGLMSGAWGGSGGVSPARSAGSGRLPKLWYGPGGDAIPSTGPPGINASLAGRFMYVTRVVFGPLVVRRSAFLAAGGFATCHEYSAAATGGEQGPSSSGATWGFEEELSVRLWKQGYRVGLTEALVEPHCRLRSFSCSQPAQGAGGSSGAVPQGPAKPYRGPWDFAGPVTGDQGTAARAPGSSSGPRRPAAGAGGGANSGAASGRPVAGAPQRSQPGGGEQRRTGGGAAAAGQSRGVTGRGASGVGVARSPTGAGGGVPAGGRVMGRSLLEMDGSDEPAGGGFGMAPVLQEVGGGGGVDDVNRESGAGVADDGGDDGGEGDDEDEDAEGEDDDIGDEDGEGDDDEDDDDDDDDEKAPQIETAEQRMWRINFKSREAAATAKELADDELVVRTRAQVEAAEAREEAAAYTRVEEINALRARRTPPGAWRDVDRGSLVPGAMRRARAAGTEAGDSRAVSPQLVAEVDRQVAALNAQLEGDHGWVAPGRAGAARSATPVSSAGTNSRSAASSKQYFCCTAPVVAPRKVTSASTRASGWDDSPPPHGCGGSAGGNGDGGVQMGADVSFVMQFFMRPSENIHGIVARLAATHPAEELIIMNDSGSHHDDWLTVMGGGPKGGTSAGAKSGKSKAATLGTVFVVYPHDLHEIRNYNTGARLASADASLLVFLQDDDLPPSQSFWVDQARALFGHYGRLGMVGGNRGRLDDSRHLKVRKMYIQGHKYGPGKYGKIPHLAPPQVGSFPFIFIYKANAAPLLVKRSSFFSVGGFEEAFSCPGEPGIGFDFEFSVRLWHRGFQVGLYESHFEQHVGDWRASGTRVAPKAWTKRRRTEVKNNRLLYSMYPGFHHVKGTELAVKANQGLRKAALPPPMS